MDKKFFGDLVASLSEAKAIAHGHAKPSREFVVEETDVKAIREGVKMTQDAFAEAMGVNVATLCNWESGYSRPRGPARVLLTIVHQAPKVFINAVGTRTRMPHRRSFAHSKALAYPPLNIDFHSIAQNALRRLACLPRRT